MTKKLLPVKISLLFGSVSLLFIWFGDMSIVSALTKEDGVAETLSAVFYLMGMLLAVLAIFKNDRVFLPIVWAILCFIFLGEETSWFQRVFDYSVPSIENINAQNEFNLHNLNVFQGGSLMDTPFALSNLMKSQNLFRIGFFGYFLLIPAFLYIATIQQYNNTTIQQYNNTTIQQLDH